MSRSTIALMLLVVTLGMAAGASTVGGSAGPVQQAVSMTTSYDGDTPSQAIEVTLTVTPTERTLSDVTIGFQPGSRTLIQSNSYSTTVTPSNHDVAVTSDGPNQFTIEELKPGEEVEIAFTVVPSTLAEKQLVPATANVAFTKNGQRVDGRVSEPVSLAGNPWEQAQASGHPQSVVLAGATLVGGLVAALVMRLWSRSRRRSQASQVRRTLHNRAESVRNAGGPTVEKRLDRLLGDVESELPNEGSSGLGSSLAGLLPFSPGSTSTDHSESGPSSGESDRSGPNL